MEDENQFRQRMEQERKRDLNPRAVVEMDRQKDFTFLYNAEVAYRGQHYVISRGCKTNDDAKQIAQKYVDQMHEAMHKAGFPIISKFPIAKE